ncbi:MAG: TGS domain-containing protein [bacterium]|nr:TGS domain-containing protein [bacterium]MDT8394857.1 TGS domain-containing protein [bacterium]
MSANLSPMYLEAEEQFRSATTPDAKLEALDKMLRLIPKHKGTEKMQSDIKKRIAKWKNLSEQAKKKGSKRVDLSHVPREGAAQAAVIGPVNTGKSSLISILTNLEPAIADYPFTTRMPQPGMMFHHGIPIQLIDTPALDPSVTERWISGLIRNADIAVVVLDLAREDLIEQWEAAHAVLNDLKIRLIEPGGEKTYQEDGWVLVPAIYLGNKCAMGEADERLAILRELFDDLPEIHPVSARTGTGLERFKDLVHSSLRLIRVFSKPPGKEPDLTQPFVVTKGATVSELATLVHKELAQRMKFGRVWGEQVYDGQRVAMDYELNDGDIVELND